MTNMPTSKDIIANTEAAVNMTKSSKDTQAGSLFEIDEKHLVRKIDYRIMPLMFLCYLMQFLDKVLINYSNVMGLSVDVNLKGNEFSWMATAFFIAYALAEIPQGELFSRERWTFLTYSQGCFFRNFQYRTS